MTAPTSPKPATPADPNDLRTALTKQPVAEYTPTTDVVRAEYWEHGAYRYGRARGDEFEAEFDRWLAAFEAEVRERIAQEIEAAARTDLALGLYGAIDIARGATR